VGLDVAVEEGEAGLVGGELDGGAAVEGHDDGVLDEAAGGLAVEVDEFELVAMQDDIAPRGSPKTGHRGSLQNRPTINR